MKLSFLKPNILTLIISSFVSQLALSGAVRDDVDYQLFRDFAENKGRFSVGATNINIQTISGESLGNLFKENVPMPDLSSADRIVGFSTLIDPQYVVGVQHNDEHNVVRFGAPATKNPDAQHIDYLITGRNNYPSPDKINGLMYDYHLPRTHKLVTEIVPTPIYPHTTSSNPLLDHNRFPAFARLGAGVQVIRNKAGKNTEKAWGYEYLIGGVPVKINGIEKNDLFHGSSPIFENHYGPMVAYGMPGDSGSPVYIYDTEEKKWMLYGVIRSYNGDTNHGNSGVLIRTKWNKETIESDIAGNITQHNNTEITWLSNSPNSSTINDGNNILLTVPLFDESLKDQNPNGYNYERPSYDHGKSIRFNGQKGILNLAQNIHQGAGALYFNTDFIVTSTNNNITWQGAGISVAKDNTVEWRIKNPTSDRLSKLGEGKLIVNGQGKNNGDISVGDGTVILNQSNGYAFNRLGIVSGRPTVIIGAENQIDPNNIYFGFRGGRLDMNGYDLTFSRIQNIDEGAKIVNHNSTKASNITLNNTILLTADQLKSGDRVNIGLDFYVWNKGDTKETFYLIPKDPNPKDRHPSYLDSSKWINLGKDLEVAKSIVLDRKKQLAQSYAFNGYFGETDSTKYNGILNVNFSPENHQSTLLLSGGTNLNGNLTTNNGTLVLSGRPTPHSYDFLKKSDVLYEDDWINRSFNATTIIANNNSTVFVGRNVSTINTNLTANHNATFNLGIIQGKTPECIRSDYTGVVKCSNTIQSDKALASIPTVEIRGNSILNNNSSLNLGKANLIGNIQGTGNVSLQADSQWIMTDSSAVENLDLVQGSNITLNDANPLDTNKKYHTLTINSNLTGNGFFRILADITKQISDKIIVNGIASGIHKLYVHNTGREPINYELELLKVNGLAQDKSKLTVSLANENGYVDLGAYRYKLFDKENSYVLGVAHRNALISLTNEDMPAIDFKNGAGVTTEDAPVAHFKNGAGVTSEDAPVAHFKNGAGVTAEDAPVAHFKNGVGVTTEDAPVAHFKNGVGVTAEDAPVAHFKNGAGVTAEGAPVAHFKNGIGVTAEDAPVAHFKNGVGVTAEDAPVAHFKNGIGVTTEDSPQQSYISRYSNTGLSELSAQVNSLLHINQNIDQEIINHDKQDLRAWAQVSKQKSKQESNLYRPYQQSINLTQFGIEQRVGNDIIVGSVLSHSSDHSQFDDGIAGKQNLKQINLYTKKMWDNGIFTAIDGSYTSSRTKLNNQLTFKRHIFSLGSILGKEWVLNNVIFKPSIGVRYYHLSKSNYSFDNANIEIEPINMISYQAGFSLSKIIQLGEFKFKPEISSYFVDASLKKLRVNVNQNALQQQFGRYMKNEIASTLQNNNWNISIGLGFTKGNEIKNQRFATLKLGYNW